MRQGEQDHDRTGARFQLRRRSCLSMISTDVATTPCHEQRPNGQNLPYQIVTRAAPQLLKSSVTSGEGAVAAIGAKSFGRPRQSLIKNLCVLLNVRKMAVRSIFVHIDRVEDRDGDQSENHAIARTNLAAALTWTGSFWWACVFEDDTISPCLPWSRLATASRRSLGSSSRCPAAPASIGSAAGYRRVCPPADPPDHVNKDRLSVASDSRVATKSLVEFYVSH